MTEKTDVLSRAELDTWRTFLRMRHALERGLDTHLASRGDLTEADYEVLRPLDDSADGELRAGVLARSIAWEASRLSHRLKGMERRGLVYRRSSRVDGRGSVIGLTEQGRAAFAYVRSEHEHWVKQNFFEVLTPTEQSTLRDLADRLLQSLLAARSSSVDQTAD